MPLAQRSFARVLFLAQVNGRVQPLHPQGRVPVRPEVTDVCEKAAVHGGVGQGQGRLHERALHGPELEAAHEVRVEGGVRNDPVQRGGRSAPRGQAVSWGLVSRGPRPPMRTCPRPRGGRLEAGVTGGKAGMGGPRQRQLRWRKGRGAHISPRKFMRAAALYTSLGASKSRWWFAKAGTSSSSRCR